MTRSSVETLIEEIDNGLSEFAFQDLCSGDAVRDVLIDLRLLANKVKLEFELVGTECKA